VTRGHRWIPAATLAYLALSAPAQAVPVPPQWQVAPPDAAPSAWQPVGEAPLPVEFQPQPATRLVRELNAEPTAWTAARVPPVIAAVGGGLRIGIGEPTYGMAGARLGVPIGEQVGVSVRPGYVFGNSDRRGRANGQGAWQIPLTVDLLPTAKASPYIRAGVATNTDSTGDTNAMITSGLDINMTRNLTLSLVLNYIIQPNANDNNGRDIEGQTLLYLRF